MNEVTYICRWTNEADEKFVKDWQWVENTVFGGFDDAVIKRKYFDNIYGPSLMIVAYMDNHPVGADAMWRNDVNGEESYQSDDTCVLETARGKGVMTGFTQKEISALPKGSYIYGSPNGKSYWAYKKMKWNEIEMYPALFVNPKRYQKEHVAMMPRDYAQWWIVGENKYHIKRFGHYYLVSTDKQKSFMANLIAEVDKETAMMYPRFKNCSLLLYRSYKKSLIWRLRKNEPMHHICWQGDPKDFPYWKIDGYGE